MSEERLDEATEQAIGMLEFTACHSFFTPDDSPQRAELAKRRTALRQRIRVLVEEARKEGYQSDKPFFQRFGPEDSAGIIREE